MCLVNGKTKKRKKSTKSKIKNIMHYSLNRSRCWGHIKYIRAYTFWFLLFYIIAYTTLNKLFAYFLYIIFIHVNKFGLSHWNGWSPSQQCCVTAHTVIDGKATSGGVGHTTPPHSVGYHRYDWPMMPTVCILNRRSIYYWLARMI